MPNDVKTIIRHHWNARAALFDTSPNHAIGTDDERDEWKRLFSSFIGSAPLRILDLGTGTGEIALLLASMGHHVTGVDFAEDMLALARAKAAERMLSASFSNGDAEALPFADGSFDAVVNRHLLWTLPHPDQALAEWKRVLVPGGKLVIVDGDWTHGQSPFRKAAVGLAALFGRRGHRPSLDVYREYGISSQLPLQARKRPAADMEMLLRQGLAAEVKSIGAAGDFFKDLPFGGTRGHGLRFVLFAQKPLS